MGTTVHDALAAIATLTKAGQPVDIDEIALAACNQMRMNLTPDESDGEIADYDYINEQGALVEGMIRGFYKHVWPNLIARYPNITFVEQSIHYDHGWDGLPVEDTPCEVLPFYSLSCKKGTKGCSVRHTLPVARFMCKPDLVLSNDDGEVVYIEYKTTGSKKESWINSWDTAVQLHSICRAVKTTLGVDITNVIVQGLYKGYESYGKQNSPFCYAYRKFGNPPFSTDQTRYDYAAGFKRYPTWDLEQGVKGWVESMPDNVLADQFPQTPPIFVKDDLVDSFFKQRAEREKQIADAMDVILNENPDDEEGNKRVLDFSFPQRFDQCQPGYGWPCSYRKLCHGHYNDPLEEGFVWREPHHSTELEQQQEA